jgi:hypothetical protein
MRNKVFPERKVQLGIAWGVSAPKVRECDHAKFKSDADVQNSTAKWVHDRTCLGCMSFSKGGEAMPVLWIDAGCA